VINTPTVIGNILFFYTVKSSSYAGILSELVSGYNIDIVKVLPFVDNSIVLPTPMGLPITLNLTAVAAIAIKGQVKVEGLTTIRAIWGNPSRISVAVNIRPRYGDIIVIIHQCMTYM
jgi:hypothetical protein